jgi:hypothetical protein
MRRPLLGALLGILLGLAIAVVLQQEGVWPLDQLTVFLMPALLGLLCLTLLSIGRTAGSTVTLVIALIILVPMAVWGAIGLGSLNEKGQLDGGCKVIAQSAVDTTSVTDSSKLDPFKIDPKGSLKWAATSPTAFMDYDWSLYTKVGGIQVPLDSGNEKNDGGSTMNGDEVPNVEAYAKAHGVDISQLRGVFIVGGQAAGTCSGFGFVLLTTASLFETLASKIALALIILIIIILIILMFTGRQKASVGSSSVADGGSDGPDRPGPAAEIAAGALESGYATPDAEAAPPSELTEEDVDEILDAADDGDDDFDL